MKKSLLALGLLTLATCVNGVVNAQTSQNGPYYANPSWDQQIPAAQRFIVLSNWNNEAVLDRETGLVWEKAPSGGATAFEWSFSIDQCTGAITGGRFGWRLPSVEELASLVDPTQTDGLPPGNPFQGVSGMSFWTATTSAFRPTNAFFVGFPDLLGFIGPGTTPKTTSGIHRWCVRSGSGIQSPQ